MMNFLGEINKKNKKTLQNKQKFDIICKINFILQEKQISLKKIGVLAFFT